MESHGVPDAIQMSDRTHSLLQQQLCDSRGALSEHCDLDDEARAIAESLVCHGEVDVKGRGGVIADGHATHKNGLLSAGYVVHR